MLWWQRPARVLKCFLSQGRRHSGLLLRSLGASGRFSHEGGRHPCDTRRSVYDSWIALTLDARRVLRPNQRMLWELLGLSRRTIQRWDQGHSVPTKSDMAKLAAAVHPHDPSLAAKLAQTGGTTLEALGIAVPAQTPLAPPSYLIDAVVWAAAEALNVAPPAVRPVLLAAFRRAREVGLRVEDVEAALGESLAPKKAGKRGRET